MRSKRRKTANSSPPPTQHPHTHTHTGLNTHTRTDKSLYILFFSYKKCASLTGIDKIIAHVHFRKTHIYKAFVVNTVRVRRMSACVLCSGLLLPLWCKHWLPAMIDCLFRIEKDMLPSRLLRRLRCFAGDKPAENHA